MLTHARVAGLLYLLTFLSSIPAALLLRPVLSDAAWIVGRGPDGPVLWACLLDVVNALACVGTAVVLFPVLRRYGEALALGFVASRLLEAAVILIGVVCLLAVVTLRDPAGPSSLATVGQALVAVRDRTFLLGPGAVPALNAVLLGSLLLRARLVPRALPLLGLAGAPLLLISAGLTYAGATAQDAPVSAVLALPIAAWELGLGVWLVVRGLDSRAIG